MSNLIGIWMVYMGESFHVKPHWDTVLYSLTHYLILYFKLHCDLNGSLWWNHPWVVILFPTYFFTLLHIWHLIFLSLQGYVPHLVIGEGGCHVVSFAPERRRLWKSSHVEKSLHQLEVTWLEGISLNIFFIILILLGLGLLNGPISKLLKKVQKRLFSCFSSTIIECLMEIL